MTSSALVLAVVLSQSLPPNHPPVGDQPVPAKTPLFDDGSGTAQALPPASLDGGSLPPGHPPVGSGQAPDLEHLMKQLDGSKELRQKDKPFEIASAIGRLYYSNARYADSVEFLEQAMAKAEPARKLFLEQRRRAQAAKKELPDPASLGCEPKSERTLEQIVELVKGKAPEAAAACLRTALLVVAETEGLLANAKFISGDAAGALARYDRILDLFEANPEARFARAAVVLDAKGDDPKLLAQAKADLERFLQDYPTSPRVKAAKELLELTQKAQAAGGMSKLSAERTARARQNTAAQAAHPPGGLVPAPPPAGGMAAPLNPDVVEAVQNTERTPELVAHLAKLVDEAEGHLAARRYQEALSNYRGVIPFEPKNARAQAGMAWALLGLDKQPMADRVWAVAVQTDPAAIDQLGETLKSKGDAKGAKELWAKLLASAPGYGGKAKLSEKAK